MLSAGRDTVDAEIADIRGFVTKSLMDLKGLLNQDVTAAKAWLSEHVDSITMTPAAEGKNRHYVASGTWDLLGRTESPTVKAGIQMVAGGGFEPPTFGL